MSRFWDNGVGVTANCCDQKKWGAARQIEPTWSYRPNCTCCEGGEAVRLTSAGGCFWHPRNDIFYFSNVKLLFGLSVPCHTTIAVTTPDVSQHISFVTWHLPSTITVAMGFNQSTITRVLIFRMKVVCRQELHCQQRRCSLRHIISILVDIHSFVIFRFMFVIS